MANLENEKELNNDEALNLEELESAAGGFLVIGGITCPLCGTPNCTGRGIDGLKW